MLSELDHGVRCERHVGEVFPPRCSDCNAAARAEDERTAPVRLGGLVECELHVGYFNFAGRQCCERCKRDAEGA